MCNRPQIIEQYLLNAQPKAPALLVAGPGHAGAFVWALSEQEWLDRVKIIVSGCLCRTPMKFWLGKDEVSSGFSVGTGSQAMCGACPRRVRLWRIHNQNEYHS